MQYKGLMIAGVRGNHAVFPVEQLHGYTVVCTPFNGMLNSDGNLTWNCCVRVISRIEVNEEFCICEVSNIVIKNIFGCMHILFTCTATWQKTTNMHILET